MKRKIIPGMRPVNWDDAERQNEYLNCVMSVMEHFRRNYSYDYLACISGCAFRACSPRHGIDPGAYHVSNDAAIIGHTFRMLGFRVNLHERGDDKADQDLIMESLDKGVPVLTFDGVVNHAECCLIAGYDEHGDILLGYSPFMYEKADHDEPADSTGYFRKSNWHDGYFRESSGRILTIGEPAAPLREEEIILESLRMAVRLIRGTASQGTEYLTGYAGHTRYAELVCEDTEDWFLLKLMVVCNSCNLYQDKVYVSPFLREAGRILKDKAGLMGECARIYDEVANLRRQMAHHIAEDLSIGELILDKEIRSQYSKRVCAIRDLEQGAADLIEKGL